MKGIGLLVGFFIGLVAGWLILGNGAGSLVETAYQPGTFEVQRGTGEPQTSIAAGETGDRQKKPIEDDLSICLEQLEEKEEIISGYREQCGGLEKESPEETIQE